MHNYAYCAREVGVGAQALGDVLLNLAHYVVIAVRFGEFNIAVALLSLGSEFGKVGRMQCNVRVQSG